MSTLLADEITGPLEVIERDIGGLEYFIVPAGGMISDDLASGLIDRDDRTPEQMRAWARLFAAAPDMHMILDELEGAFDKEIYPEQVKEDFDALDEREYSVTITAKQWRAISRALSKVQHGK